MAYITLNGKDGAFSYIHNHRNWVEKFLGGKSCGMLNRSGPSISWPLDKELTMGHSATLARIVLPREKNNQHTFKTTQLKKKVAYLK